MTQEDIKRLTGDLAHELWAAAQLVPGESITDGVNRIAAILTRLSEPVAWREFDGEGGYDYRSYQDNETFHDDYVKRNPNPIYKDWVEPLFRKPEVK